jgi:hypothetical protein
MCSARSLTWAAWPCGRLLQRAPRRAQAQPSHVHSRIGPSEVGLAGMLWQRERWWAMPRLTLRGESVMTPEQ